jgi:hypothetical protein
MHGTGFVFAATALNRGGTVVTLPEQRFDAERLLDAIVAHGVTDLCIVGDAFCRPRSTCSTPRRAVTICRSSRSCRRRA